MKNTKPKVQGCLACEHGINVNLGRKRAFEFRQIILPSLVRDSFWMVKFDADGKVLIRHEHEDDVDHGDSKRVRFTHKQPDKRADLELTASSSSFSSHEFAPNMHDSSGGIGCLETRESAVTKSRVGAGVEISAIEALTNTKLEVDRALDKAKKDAASLA